jgi:hypothetical protein
MKQRQRPLRLRQNSGTSSVPIEKILIVVLAQRRHCRNVTGTKFYNSAMQRAHSRIRSNLPQRKPSPGRAPNQASGLSFRPVITSHDIRSRKLRRFSAAVATSREGHRSRLLGALRQQSAARPVRTSRSTSQPTGVFATRWEGALGPSLKAAPHIAAP